MKRTRRLRITTHFAIRESGFPAGPCPRCEALGRVAETLGIPPMAMSISQDPSRGTIDRGTGVCAACARDLGSPGSGPIIDGKVIE